jgi:hypothetical protein
MFRALVELDDLDRDALAEQRIDVLDLAQRDLRSGQERFDAVEIHDDAALDLPDQLAFDDLSVVVSILDAIPDAHEIRALLGEHDESVLVLHLLQEHVDRVADLDAARIRELGERDDALALEADVHEHVIVVDREHRAAHDFALADGAHGLFVLAEHLGAHFVREFVFVVRVKGQQGQLGRPAR